MRGARVLFLISVVASTIAAARPAAAAPTFSVSPTSVTFTGSNRVATPAAVQSITISNAAGAEPLTYAAATSSGTEFPLSCAGGGTACLSGSVPGGASAQLQVGFVPSAVGARSGMVTLTTNDPDPPDATRVIAVSGSGAISTLSSAASLAFGAVDINAAGGVTQNLTISNTGGVSLNISSMAITGDASFSFAFGACTTGQSCGAQAPIVNGTPATVTLRCDPSTIGAKTGTLTVDSDDPTSPKTVALTCTGATPDLQLAGPPLADFGSQRINTSSATTRTFTLSNPTGATVAALTYAVSEVSPHFAIACSAPGCSGTVPPGGTPVTVTVSFRPTMSGPVTGNINVASNDVSTPSVDVPVTGTGVEPLVALTAPAGGSLSFSDTNVGATSAAQTITITNTGSMPLTVAGVTNSNTADYNLTGPSTATVAPAGTQSWTVACAPDTQGTRTGTITITNDSNNQAAVMVLLTCSAIRGHLAVSTAAPFAYVGPTNTIDFGPTVLHQAKTTTVTLINDGNRAVVISAGALADPAQGYTLGSVTPATVAPGGTATLSVTFLPTLDSQGTTVVNLTTNWDSVSFTVTGDGVPSALAVITGSGASCSSAVANVDYGRVPWNATKPQLFCITNLGQAVAPLTAVTLSSGSGDFTLTGVPGTLPTLSAGQHLDVTITADPNDTMLGVFTATLDVTSALPPPDNHRTVALMVTSVGPTMALSPGATLDFGPVDVDRVGGRVLPLTVTNMMPAGATPLNITSISAPTGPFTLIGPPASVVLDPGDSTTLMVRYDPTVERSTATLETSTFTITTAGYFVGGVRQPLGAIITLTGYGVDRHVAVVGDGGNPVLHFGDVYRNPRADDPRATKTLQVCNTGEAALAVSMVTGAAAPFAITSATGLNLPGVPGPGGAAQCRDVTVEFRPADLAYQTYAGMLTVVNDDDGAAMVAVPLDGTSIARPVNVTAAVTSELSLAVGVATRLTEVFPGGITVTNVSTPAEGFTVELVASDAQAVVVGAAERDLPAGANEIYDLTITATAVGPLTFVADVYLDGDPSAHAKVPITLTATAREPDDMDGCSAGRGRGGWLALTALALALGRRARRRR